MSDWKDKFLDKVVCGDSLKLMRELPEKTIDVIITDPPYGINLAEWDKSIDIAILLREAKRILRADGFLAFFGQMPTVLTWLGYLEVEGFKYCEHIVWVKRHLTQGRLSRGHESIYVYCVGKSRFHNTRDRFEDVRIPGILFDVSTMEGLQRYVSALWRQIETGEVGERDADKQKRREIWKRFADSSLRAPREVNFSNVWSFLPENLACVNKEYTHPAVKPLALMVRLIKLLTAPNQLILDCFFGSGTTGVAAKQLGRHFIGMEIEPKYCEMAETRLMGIKYIEGRNHILQLCQ